MIHVAVTDEDVSDVQQIARRQRRQIAKIEQQGATAKAEINEEPGVSKNAVHKTRLNQPAHEGTTPAGGARRDLPHLGKAATRPFPSSDQVPLPVAEADTNTRRPDAYADP